MIAILNPIGANFESVASSGRPDDVAKANKYVDELNGRMRKCDTLSKSIDWNKAKANRPVKEVSVTLSAPVRQPQPVPQEVVEERVDFVRPIETLSPACKYAIDEFNRIYARYQALTKQDVWTGKSNDVVHAWSNWCTNHSGHVSNAVKSSTGNPPQELRDIVAKYNTFGQDLTSKINQWALTQHQQNFINRYQSEHDDCYNGFKRSTANLSVCEDYQRKLQKLSTDLDNLGLHGHPSVVMAQEITHDSLRNMTAVINQLRIDPQTKINFTETAKPQSAQPVSNAPRAAFCSECGAKNTGGGKFCGDCGAAFAI